jgi:hypothetical protein
MDEDHDNTVPTDSVLRLIIAFLKEDTSEEPCDVDSEEVSDSARATAGCALWDLAASEESAALMAEHGISSVVAEVLKSCSSTQPTQATVRLQEISCGMLANVCAHNGLRTAVIDDNDLAVQLLTVLYCSSDSPTLTELLRLLSAAAAYDATAGSSSSSSVLRTALTSADTLDRVGLLLEQALNTLLLARAAEFLHLVAYYQGTQHINAELLSTSISVLAEHCADLACAPISAASTGLDALLELLECVAVADKRTVPQQLVTRLWSVLVPLVLPYEHSRRSQETALVVLGWVCESVADNCALQLNWSQKDREASAAGSSTTATTAAVDLLKGVIELLSTESQYTQCDRSDDAASHTAAAMCGAASVVSCLAAAADTRVQQGAAVDSLQAELVASLMQRLQALTASTVAQCTPLRDNDKNELLQALKRFIQSAVVLVQSWPLKSPTDDLKNMVLTKLNMCLDELKSVRDE